MLAGKSILLAPAQTFIELEGRSRNSSVFLPDDPTTYWLQFSLWTVFYFICIFLTRLTRRGILGSYGLWFLAKISYGLLFLAKNVMVYGFSEVPKFLWFMVFKVRDVTIFW